ncbi:MAG: peptide chain release factor N(5)-glutamine methyltransferase [Planctomycetales bacterium]|nr:peptide chain release factor N(5)-glutamine methyltransferase [Planctomycetales bacterium]
MDEQNWTVGRLLSWTTDYLNERGAESARLDAEVLLAHARGCQRIELYTAFEEVAADAVRERFRELVKQRAAGKPVAYLVGSREFFSLPFEVNSDVLIPRPETEAIVVRGLDLLKGKEGPLGTQQARVADVGTGSGILAICLVRGFATAAATAMDLSEAALAVAARNAERHGVADRIDFVASDLFASLPPTREFDLIVSNPPYVKSGEMASLQTDVRQYEPALALDGGIAGTDVIARLLPQVAERLVVGGRFLMEIGPSVAAEVEQLVSATPALELIEIHDDLSGMARIVEAVRNA